MYVQKMFNGKNPSAAVTCELSQVEELSLVCGSKSPQQPVYLLLLLVLGGKWKGNILCRESSLYTNASLKLK